MYKVHAPFNFVPTDRTVLLPFRDEPLTEVQDVPYADGFSGTIHLKVTAKTPVYIRNGHAKSDEDRFKEKLKGLEGKSSEDIDRLNELVNENPEYCLFNHTSDGRYFIPATSLKGEIRNLLSILSMGKMVVDKSLKPAIQREIGSKKNATGLYTLLADQKSILAGWIQPAGDHYEIKRVKDFYRVNLRELDRFFGFNKFKDHFEKSKFNNNDKWKTAKYKYELLRNGNPRFDLNEQLKVDFTVSVNKRTENLIPGSQGIIVLTGQPSGASDWDTRCTDRTNQNDKRKPSGKFWDFIFSLEITETYTISDEEFSRYDSVYGDSIDWTELKKAMSENQPFPIFFRTANGKVKDFGLTYLYKLPYNQTPLQMEQKRSGDYECFPDMAERIFGYTNKPYFKDYNKGKDTSVRGRVQFQHLFCTHAETNARPVAATLNGPKITYYPIYVRQDLNDKGEVRGTYKTYNDGELSGWKRYVRRNKAVVPQHTINAKLESVFMPLNTGSVFEGDVSFHNLKEAELGALLSALTFHNTSNCYHLLGAGKPYGFGCVSMEASLSSIIANDSQKTTTLEQAIAQFENIVRKEDIGWFESSTIKELFAFASLSDSDAKPGVKFDYMKMDLNNKNNEFVQAKDSPAEGLLSFSRLVEKAGERPNLCLTAEDLRKEIEAEKRRLEQQRQKEQKEALERQKKEQEAKVISAMMLSPIGEDIVFPNVKDFTQLKGRCKKQAEALKTDEGLSVVHQWLQDYFSAASSADKKQLRKDKKWIDTFGGIVSDETWTSWKNEFAPEK